ncbi:MAG: hypothetical protein RLZZ519_2468 [Bacteroidota bacterium]|jgi:hypothetical protein
MKVQKNKIIWSCANKNCLSVNVTLTYRRILRIRGKDGFGN